MKTNQLHRNHYILENACTMCQLVLWEFIDLVENCWENKDNLEVFVTDNKIKRKIWCKIQDFSRIIYTKLWTFKNWKVKFKDFQDFKSPLQTLQYHQFIAHPVISARYLLNHINHLKKSKRKGTYQELYLFRTIVLTKHITETAGRLCKIPQHEDVHTCNRKWNSH